MYTTFIYQKGSALVISLVFMLLMMIVGIGAMQSSTLQERMAGNARDINSAFQAAEAALRQGEKYLADTANLPEYPDGTNGLFELCPLGATATSSEGGEPEEADPNAGEGAAETSEDGEGEGNSGGSSTCAPNWNSKSESNWVEYSGDFGGGVSRNPEYIIEKYMEPLEGDTLNANQILEDSNLYRITARGYGVSDHSVVILQSVYRKD